MKNQIENWEKEINAVTHDFKTAFGNLTTEQLNLTLNAQTWSIAQNIDHLIVINETYYPVIEKIRKGEYSTPFLSKFGFITRFFGNFILKSVNQNRDKKIKTFPIWQPAQSNIQGDILQKFEKHQAELIAFIKSCEDLLEKNTIISSPANKNIVYTLDKAFDIIIEHEKRHFNQAKEVLSHKTIPSV
jgi:hypothetical protein